MEDIESSKKDLDDKNLSETDFPKINSGGMRKGDMVVEITEKRAIEEKVEECNTDINLLENKEAISYFVHFHPTQETKP